MESSALGIVSLDTDGGERFASILLVPDSGAPSIVRVPYDWTAEQFYLLLALPLADNEMGGFVYTTTSSSSTSTSSTTTTSTTTTSSTLLPPITLFSSANRAANG